MSVIDVAGVMIIIGVIRVMCVTGVTGGVVSGLQLLCDNQHCFSERRSCITQLLQIVHNWLSIKNKRESSNAVFLDFAKAFDKVSHIHLIRKLHFYGIQD